MVQTVLTVTNPAISSDEVRAIAAYAVEAGYGLCVEPSMLQAAAEVSTANLPVVTWAGYPSGKHHTLVKAAEARLAIQFGATEVAIVPDLAQVSDQSALMSELIAVRDAVPHPARLGLVLETTKLAPDVLISAARCAAKCGFDAIVTGTEASSVEGVEALRSCLEVRSAGMDVSVVTSADQAEAFRADSYWILSE